MNKFHAIFTGAILATLLTPPLQAKTMEQGGDISEGRYNILTKDHIISYYANGKTGKVNFYCQVFNYSGSDIKISMVGGKNFAINMPQILKKGYNGPWTWQLRDFGSDVGNIKLKLIQGNEATVLCQQNFYN